MDGARISSLQRARPIRRDRLVGRARRGRVAGRRRDRWRVRTAAAGQFTAPTGIPQVPVQVEPEAPVGMRMRVVPGSAAPRPLPQGERDALSGIRPGRRRPHHQVQWRCGVAGPVAGQRDGEAGPEPAVRGDPGQVPAEQVRREQAQIRPEAGGEIGAVAVPHGAQIEIYVDPGGGARPRPVAPGTPCRRGLDHGRWHGVLAHALPHQQVGRKLVHEVRCHQHSPCVNDSPIRYEEKFFIARIVATARTICQPALVADPIHCPAAAVSHPPPRADGKPWTTPPVVATGHDGRCGIGILDGARAAPIVRGPAGGPQRLGAVTGLSAVVSPALSVERDVEQAAAVGIAHSDAVETTGRLYKASTKARQGLDESVEDEPGLGGKLVRFPSTAGAT